MDFGPGYDQSLLAEGKASPDLLDRIGSEDTHPSLVVGVKVRSVVWTARFDKHPNHDSEETADLWHDIIIADQSDT